MNHKYFSIKELKKSLKDQPAKIENMIGEIASEMLLSLSYSLKKPAPQKGPAFFSYKGLNLN